MRARHLKAQGKLGLITIDHAQLVTYRGSERHDMRQRVTRVTADTKALAQELGVPVVLLSQLRRCEPGQQEREPELDDLRDSGSLEQDAEKVVFLYPDEEKKAEMEEGNPQATKNFRPVICEIAKHRNGETGVVNFWHQAHYFRFDEAGENWEFGGPTKKAKDAPKWAPEDLP